MFRARRGTGEVDQDAKVTSVSHSPDLAALGHPIPEGEDEYINSIIMPYHFPQPKKDPLRPFPAELAKHTEHIVVEAETTQERILAPKPGITDITIDVGEKGACTIMLAANYEGDAFRLANLRATVGKDAVLHVIDRVSGGSRVETRAILALTGSGAEGKVTAMYHGRHEQHHACHVIVDHAVPNTRGDVFVRGVYENQSRSVFTGLIKIAPHAQQTRSYYRDDVLLLDGALAESLPTLEIEANDVKASHGSTTSRINDDQLFYMMSRGIGPEQARGLVVAGFLTPALARLPEALCAPFLTMD